ncbi:MAG TPA: carboxypeptidase-like regulatory domain-containing protein [Pyrinomonadaceae bacterium]|nr:carboxypeptidase-like regulatory domain-containing protein [Pyrinomonadaceae bacterium]
MSPADSSVWLNGESQKLDTSGTIVLTLPPMSYTITARHPGYGDAEQTVDLKAGDTSSLTLTLELLKATLTVQPTVDGTAIEVRNIDRNQHVGSYASAIEDVAFPPGEYEITVSRAGYAVVTRTVTLKPGGSLEIEPRLDALPPPRPPPRPVRPMTVRVETEGKYLIVYLSGSSPDDSTSIGTINVTASKLAPAFPEVRGNLGCAPCGVALIRVENVTEGSFIEAPGPSNQHSRIIVRIRPKDSKRPVRFAINWRSLEESQSPEASAVIIDATPEHKVTPASSEVARFAPAQRSVRVTIAIDKRVDVISAKAIDVRNYAEAFRRDRATANQPHPPKAIRLDFEQ